MIWLANGERALVQWSRGNVVLLTTRGDEVRVSREDDRISQVITTTKTGNLFRAEIPDRMMTESGYIRVVVINRADDGEAIIDRARFTIRAAQRPKDYVHGSSETADWKALRAQMNAILRDVREGKFTGLPGKDGATPYIGGNKNWYIAGVDTGIRAEGLDYILTREDKEEVVNTISDEFKSTFAGLFTSGIISGGDPDAMKAFPPEGDTLRVRIPPGTVLIEGVAKAFNTQTRYFTLATPEVMRREVGFLRLVRETGKIEQKWRRVEIREGKYWSEEDGYLPVRDDTYYDLLNCYVEIPAGATVLTDDMIVDLRHNPELCGFVESNVPYSLRGTTADITPADVYNAVLDGRMVVLTHEDGDAGMLVFNGFVFEEARQEISASAVIEVGGVNRVYKLFGAIDGTVWSSMLADMGSGGGTGGGSGNNAVLVLTNTTGWVNNTLASGASCVVSASWSSLEDGMATGDGSLRITVNGVTKISKTVKQGDIVEELKDHLSLGSNTVKITVADVYGNSRSLILTVTTEALSIVSSFDASIAYTGDILFTYTPVGAMEKQVYILLDDEVIHQTTVTTSGRQQAFTIPAPSHGSHELKVYFKAMFDGVMAQSNTLYYEIICVEQGNNTPIIACAFTRSEAEQYETVAIPYIVYSPASLTSQITLAENGTEVASLTVDRTYQTWSYRPMETGEVELTITCGDTVKTIDMTVRASELPVQPETEFQSLYLSSYGRSNNENDPSVWKYGDVEAELTGFNFVSDGWVTDEDGVTALRVAGDARVNIPYQIFKTDGRTSGKTVEIEFATRNVLNYDAVIFSCLSDGRGIEVTTQKAYLASEQSTIGTQYKEEEHVRLSFVVEKRTDNKLLLCYINGILSGSVLYPDDDDFSQLNPVGITIGSNECTTDVYCIRVYDNNLTRYQLLDNWIADTQTSYLRNARYKRNDIYDTYGQVTIATLKKDVPYLVLQCPVLPSFKGDKKTCSGYYVDPVHAENSFSFSGAEIDVQGTSSQYYYVKNYKIKYKGGFILWNGTSAEVYQMNTEAVPTNTFTYKADVASSEGANNVVLAQLYTDLCDVKTPPQEEDPRVRQTIDGHPIVIFWDNGSKVSFIGKYNFNNDKGTEEVFGFADGDESWEILQNGTDRVGWRDDDFSGTAWKNDFEARYPEDNVNTTNLAAFATWIKSTNTDAATGAALGTAVTYDGVTYTADTVEYRLAKFKAELADHADIDALVFYYLFTEIFLCIDQREKNAFPTLWDATDRWMMLFYDADSSLGTDNKGNLAFDYYLEDIDYTDAGEPVYNGQNSVLWKNIRAGFYGKITDEYKRLRTTIREDGTGRPLISYDVVNDKFEAHQSIWSEAIYNEDGYRKCIEPLVLNGDTTYLGMLQGKKEQHRKWWLYNRFRYLDSKYVTGSSMDTRILIRAHAKGNVTLTAYVNMYGHVYYNAEMVEHRMFRGQPYEFVWAASGAEDTVIGINDADMLTSLGDLSPIMVETIDISPATHLTYLKVGDAAEGYTNANLNTLTLGNNTLMRLIDARNCINLAGAVNAAGCTGLEEAYFDNTAITGLTLPNGAAIKKLHLPETITNLTLMNCTALTEFVLPSYANISTLRLENVPGIVPVNDILAAVVANSRIRIIGFEETFESEDELKAFIARLDTMRGIDESGNNVDLPQISGTVVVPAIRPSTIKNIQTKYPSITVVYTEELPDVSIEIVQRTLTGTYTNNRVKRLVNMRSFGAGLVEVNFGAVTEVADYAFARGTSNTPNAIKTINLQSAVTIGTQAFQNAAVSSISIPKVEIINDDAFTMSALQTIELPSVTAIGGRAFRNATALTTVILSNTAQVATLGTGAFYGTKIASGTGYIYVPKTLADGSDGVTAYKNSTNWSTFGDQILAIEDHPEIFGGEA